MRYRKIKEWTEFLHPVTTCCGLCGNTGIIDTRGRAITPAGYTSGVRRFCICPNGRVLKKAWSDKQLAVDE